MILDQKLIGFINVFEKFTRSRVKDCFYGENKLLIFVIRSGDLGKAIGKSGINVKKLSFKLKQRLRIIGFSEDPVAFVKNILFPLKGFEVVKEESKILIKTEDRGLKGKIYGRERSNLKEMNVILKKYFKDLEVEVE